MKNKHSFSDFVIVSIFISVFTLLPDERACMSDELMNNIEDLVFDAVRKEYDWTRQHELRTRLLENPYFKKSLIYDVFVPTDNPPTYIVTSDMAGDTDVFLSCPDIVNHYNIKRFSKVIRRENIRITEDNIRSYADSFLFLADHHSVRIDDFDDIYDLFSYIGRFVRDDTKYRKAVRPITYEFGDNKIIIRFCSWKNRGYLRKWKLEVLPNGEILTWDAENILVLYF